MSESLYFSLLPSDVLILLLLYFPANDLLNILDQLESIKIFNMLLSSKNFWNKIWRRDISSITNLPENPYEKYKEINRIVENHLSNRDITRALTYLAENGYDVWLLHLLPRKIYGNEPDYYFALTGAAKGGFITLIQSLIDKDTKHELNYNAGMVKAAEGGHIDIVKLMLKNGATDYNLTMRMAARKGHMNIIKLMLSEGATIYNEALKVAAGGGYMDIVKLMLDLGANNIDDGLEYAAAGGHMNIVRLMLDLGATRYSIALISAMQMGHNDVADFISRLDNISYNDVIINAIDYGFEYSFIKSILDKIPLDKRKSVNVRYILKMTVPSRDIAKLLKSYKS